MTARTTSDNKYDLSVIITAHAEGILLHKTLASVRRALAPLHEQGATTEIIIHADNPSPDTEAYLQTHATDLKDTSIYTNTFGDLGASRNFAVSKASGTYVTFIDADDLMSELWLAKAYAFLEAHTRGEYIAHTEYTVEFGAADSVVRKYGEINQATDTLLSVFANRWNSIIMAPRTLLLEEPYTPNSPGYGYEDWHLNSRFIHRGIHNVLIPGTVIFVRRKEANSEWLRQKQSRAVLRANPLFSFDHVRNLAVTDAHDTRTTGAAVTTQPSAAHKVKQKVQPLLNRAPQVERYARGLYRLARKAAAKLPTDSAEHLPAWLIDEWRAMHAIDKQLFPSGHLIKHVPIYESLTPDHYRTAQAFKEIIDHTRHNHYDYVFFVPWLIHGGADLFTLHYAQAIHKQRAGKRVLVIATLPNESPWATRLGDTADFIPFGTITDGLGTEVQYRLLEQLIENSGASHLHIINSALGYDFINSHRTYITATKKHVIATSFSQSTDTTGRVFGYSHTHVPEIYDIADAITTDNHAVVRMWIEEYGFDPAKLLVHHQPVTLPAKTAEPHTDGPLRVLWAARLSPEKQAALVPHIAQLLPDTIRIDMYGHADNGYDTAFLQELPANVTYKGAFNGFYSLPIDTYDAYLYTSLFDGMPNALLEAGVTKLPIISAAVGGVPELIKDHETGLLVDDHTSPQAYANQLRYAAEHRDVTRQMAAKLYRTITTDFSQDAFDKSVASFLKKIDL